ncbi:MAG: V-type ATP synthase subunit E family protein [Spirochaetaceae bacterium]|jgi:vacuolar-type H+-ATPase subunit E/Vma4|nr:V-type ATP synthase subunit E family protein [Spirochaetaceae bacterium]
MKNSIPDDLLSGIAAEAENEAKLLLAEAEKNKTQKLASAKMRETRLIEESREKGEKQAAVIRKLAASSIAVELRKLALKREENLFSQIIKAVRQQFLEFTDSQNYKDALIGWIAEGAIGIGTDKINIHASEKVLPFLAPDLLKKTEEVVLRTIGKNVTFSPVKDEGIDDCGVILKDQTGRLLFDNRVEARLRRYEHHIRGIIARELLQE